MSTLFIGSSLKMYFSHARTVEWTTQVAEVCRNHPAVTGGAVTPFVIPSFTALTTVLPVARAANMLVGAQDTHWEDSGAFTGEVSPTELAEIGVQLVEVGHAERRSIFGEDDDVVAAKVAAIVRNQMTPLLCVGEQTATSPDRAIAECVAQVASGLSRVKQPPSQLIIGYEPIWAIGAPAPAGPEHITAVCSGLRAALRDRAADVRVIYGGSAGPGLLPTIHDSVDGMFLGRFAHDPRAFAAILDEAWALVRDH